MDIFEKCPALENEKLLVRLIRDQDAEDLLQVYGDKFALPFFNSDNCHGSSFYCRSMEDMANTIKYWLMEYHEYKGFVRFSVIDKTQGRAVGTIEMFNRRAGDYYDNCGICGWIWREAMRRPRLSVMFWRLSRSRFMTGSHVRRSPRRRRSMRLTGSRR